MWAVATSAPPPPRPAGASGRPLGSPSGSVWLDDRVEGGAATARGAPMGVAAAAAAAARSISDAPGKVASVLAAGAAVAATAVAETAGAATSLTKTGGGVQRSPLGQRLWLGGRAPPCGA